MMIKIIACAIATGLGVLVMVNVAHAQDASPPGSTIKIDATHIMICGAPHDMQGGSGKVADCRIVTVKGGK